MDSAPPLPCPGCGSQQSPHSNRCPPLPPEVDHVDYLAIDDLLDFSNEDIGGLIEPCISNATSEAKFSEVSYVISSIDSRKPAAELDFNELCPPCDELAELEWLSNFVEESFSLAGGDDSANRLMPLGSFAAVGNGNVLLDHDRFKTTSPVSVLETNPFPRDKLCSPFSSSTESCGSVPGRARSKRRRTAVCFWNTHILSSTASESLLDSSNEYTTMNMASASSQSSVLTYYEDEGDESDEGDDPRALLDQRGNHKKAIKHLFKERGPFKLYYKKPKKFKVEDAPTTARKCLHCGMQKTPQWRAGPMGPKTLCNACGVRYKSGRLCDEYRPAASPTFNENVHSNSHRKVLEMRRQMGEKASKGSHEQAHRLHVGSNGGLCPNKKARLSSEESD